MPLPIVLRELRVKARHKRTYYTRCAMVALATATSLGFMRWSSVAGSGPAVVGHHIFWAFSAIAFAFSALAGPLVTADCLSEEKREGTLGLLFLTDLKGYDVVLGKLVSTSLPVLYCLIAAIPILALPFFFGGVTPGEFWRMTTVLLTTLFFSLSAGIFISAISWDGRRAFVAATATIVLAALGPVSISYFGIAPRAFWAALIAAIPGPGQLFFAVSENRYSSVTAPFWRSVIGLALLSGALLIIASYWLPFAWQQNASFKTSGRRSCPPRSRGALARFNPLTSDGAHGVRALPNARRALAGSNPITWLAERTTINPLISQAFWIMVALLWFIAFESIRHRLLPVSAVVIAIYLMHATVKCWAAWEASRRFADDKRSGALELLLTTPLGERQILVGWLIGLKRRFLLPIAMLLVLDLHLWWVGDHGEWLLALVPTMGLFVADTYTICWFGLWMGLTARTSTEGFFKTVGWVLFLPWIWTFLILAIFGLIGGGRNFADLGVLSTGWFLVGYILDFGLCAWGIHRLSDDFRVTAAKQYEPHVMLRKLPHLKPMSSWSFEPLRKRTPQIQRIKKRSDR